MSAETREKLRLVNLGNKNSAGKSRNLTDEQRAAFAERARQRSADPEIRTKISNTLRGHKQSVETVARRVEALKRAPRRQVRDHLGNIYRSAEEAARVLNISPPNICNVLKGRQASTKGFSFNYVRE